MASGRPAGASTEPARMVLPADKDPSRSSLLLEVAFKAQDVIALGEHPRVDRTVRLVAGSTALAHRFVLEDKGAALGNVAFAAGLLLSGERRTATNNRLTLVWIMTVRATDPLLCADRTRMRTVEHRMRVREAKFTTLVEMTLKTGFRRAVWIDYRMRGAARLFVNAARTMAGLATDVHRVFGFSVQSGVSSRRKALVDFGMAFPARCRPNELRSGNFRRRNNGPVKCAARKQRAGGDYDHPENNAFPWITLACRCYSVGRIVAHELAFCCRYDPGVARLRDDAGALSTTSGFREVLLNSRRLEHEEDRKDST